MNRVVQYVALTLAIIASQNVSGREREVPLVAGTPSNVRSMNRIFRLEV